MLFHTNVFSIEREGDDEEELRYYIRYLQNPFNPMPFSLRLE